MTKFSNKKKFLSLSFLYIIFIVFPDHLTAQHEVLPSLFKERPTIKNDTVLVDWYFKVSVGYHLSDFKKCIAYGDSCINLALKTKQDKHLINALNNVGGAYQSIGDYTKSLEYLYKALRVAEFKNDKMIIAYALDNIGITLQIMKRYKQALDYQLKSLQLEIEIADFYGVGTSCINIGQTYLFLNDFKKAEEYYFKALEIGKQYQHKLIEAHSYNSIAQLFFEKKEFNTALQYNIAALKLFESIQDRNGTTNALLSIASIYYELADYKNAKSYLQRAVNDATLFETKQVLSESYKLLSEANEKLGNISEALKYHKLYAECNDSIYNEKSINIITEMSTKYETEKKEAENLILNKNREIQEKEIQKQGILKNSFIFGFIFALLFLILLMNRYRIKQKANSLLNIQKNEILKQKDDLQILNLELAQQKEEITAQRDEIDIQNQHLTEANKIIEQKNKNITDSIKYALRIQSAILPPQELINHLVPDTFVLYKPKSIVSGDFYYLESKDDHIYFAAVDCTGHGVPGAFMSIVGYNLLNQALNEKNITEPHLMLNYLSEAVSKTLRQNDADSSLRDGMDLVLCRLNKNTLNIKIAGVHNSLYLIRDHNLTEFKGDKWPIGKTFCDRFPTYNSHEYNLVKNDILYLFSDGFIDQFNSETGKKYTSARFKELLLQISNLSMPEQQKQLAMIFEKWKGNSEQIDDVMVLGIKI